MSRPEPERQPGIDPEVSRAWTLPASLYTDPQQLALENESIFRRSWQIVGRSAQVAAPGDYFTAELAGEPLLLVRDTAGQLRGFYNLCRHRAGPPAQGCGNRKAFRCAYHGWTYSLEGALLSAPEMEGACGFRPQDFGLAPVRAAEWAGLVFVNLDDTAQPLQESLGELPRQAAKFGFQRMQWFERRDYLMECNWKTYIDNYLEGYHLPSVHPSLNRELDYGEYRTELFARHSLQWSPIRAAENAGDQPRRYRQASGGERAEYYWVFPNWMLNCYPDNVSLNLVLPLGAEKCVAAFEWYFPPELMATEVPRETVRFSHEIQLEDGAICEAVQRNLRSRAYQRGRFSPRQERGVHHFHCLYQQAMVG
jgi:choline monooxygenase